MSYQVLARKWRPSTFEEMVGQVHVLRALVNALDQGRLHHAYLFTGTRGVGKTTIARLLAKSLNCEQGVSSKPCGQCSACQEIAEGRFVDLIEVDAASRTKVEDTRELLENVQYAPTRGRYKVYLIDEVHMLSTSSFNALLKTLEEPPPHVKFLLATTDPQKLPVTVLSRCLQFNLKNMSREHIVSHLSHILKEEQVPFDEPSLWSIAEGAQGSMRDALSLTDQAIAFGQGALKEDEVASMLGTVDLKRVLNLVHALLEKNGDRLMQLIADIDEHAPDYQSLMTEFMSTLHRVAIAQAVPAAIDNHKGDQAAILELAKSAHAEDVHLYYQIAAKAKTELGLAPSERAGFEMAVLRMLAFSQTPAAQVSQLPELSSQPAPSVEAAPAPPKPEAEVSQSSVVSEESQPSAEIVEKAPVPKPEPVEASPMAEPDTVEPNHSEFPQPETNQIAVKETDAETAGVPAFVVETEIEPKVEHAAMAASDSPDAMETDVTEAETHSDSELNPVAVVEVPNTEPAMASVPNENVRGSESDASAGPETVATWPAVDLESDPVFWWQVTLHRLGLSGMTKTLFANSQWQDYQEGVLSLTISPNYRKIMNETHQAYLLKAITNWLPDCHRLVYEFGVVEKTPQLWVDQLIQQANDKAYTYLNSDNFVQNLVNEFSGELQRESAVPNNSPIPSGA